MLTTMRFATDQIPLFKRTKDPPGDGIIDEKEAHREDDTVSRTRHSGKTPIAGMKRATATKWLPSPKLATIGS